MSVETKQTYLSLVGLSHYRDWETRLSLLLLRLVSRLQLLRLLMLSSGVGVDIILALVMVAGVTVDMATALV